MKVRGITAAARGKFARPTGMKMTMSTGSTMTPRIHRKVLRAPSKLHPGKRQGNNKCLPSKLSLMHQHHQSPHAGKIVPSRGKLSRPFEACDNSNDSGLGFDHPLEMHPNTHRNTIRFSEQLDTPWAQDSEQPKNPKPDLKFHSDNANDNYNFTEMTRPSKQLSSSSVTYRTGIISGKVSNSIASKRKSLSHQSLPPLGPVNLCSQLSSQSRDGRVQLQIVSQPEQQHRARYQTEGSRGAVKDRSGNSFPVVKLIGYDRPAVLQVFIGTDVGRAAPHMFYQACRVFGKNSTPCNEKKEDGTVLIEIDLCPQKTWQVTCDCVGILKERNVDVEHRFGDQTGQRSKKKSTRCRMIFRTQLQHSDGTTETIQVCSQPIVCTQPPGVPEICRKSLVSCPASGGLELFLIGKNFLKDTKVVFQSEPNGSHSLWEEQVFPDKEFLQQNHLVCGVPPFRHTNISESIAVRLFVVSGGKPSESLKFMYTPIGTCTEVQHATVHHSAQGPINGYYIANNVKEEVKPILMWESGSTNMMPPPAAPLRRPSVIIPDQGSATFEEFKSELADDSSQGSAIDSENGDVPPVRMRSGKFKICDESSMDVTENSIDGLHMRGHRLPIENISRDSNLCVSIAPDNPVGMIRLSEDGTNVCRMDRGDMELLIRHDDTTEMSVMKENSVNDYPLVSSMSSQIIESQLIGVKTESPPRAMSDASPLPCDIMNPTRRMSPDELKVMDLRMKPETVVSDSDPSLATYRRFVDTQNKLPTQTGQSVETYLCNINNKSLLRQNMDMEKANHMVAFPHPFESLQNQNATDKVMESVAAAIFNSTQESRSATDIFPRQTSMVMPPVNPIDQLIATKQMHDTIMSDIPYTADIITTTLDESQVKADIYNSNCARVELVKDMIDVDGQLPHQNLMSNRNARIEAMAFHANMIPSDTSSNLESIIESSLETHLSPSRSESSASRGSPSSHDIILSSHSGPELVMGQAPQMPPVDRDLMHSHRADVLSPEVILNAQVSPTVMCSRDGALLGSQPLASSISRRLLPDARPMTRSPADELSVMTGGDRRSPPSDGMGLIMSPTVKTPPSTVKTMIWNAAVEIFNSDKAINALVTTAIETANILTGESQPSLVCAQTSPDPASDPQGRADRPTSQFAAALPFTPQMPPERFASRAIVERAVGDIVSQMKDDTGRDSVMSRAVSRAVTQVFSRAVTRAVDQEMKTSDVAPMQTSISDGTSILTSMSDNELLNYINPSCFDQVLENIAT